MNNKFVPFLPPWAETGLQPAFYDVESGTVLQQTARMYDKVNQLIRLFNELSEETKATVEEYIAKFIELKEFVDDYFDNLDVQEEINNKLDEMVEDGTLQEIIDAYITSEVRYYFPKFMEDAYSQDFSIIVHDYNGDKKYIMVDAGRSAQWADVLEMITTSGCTHIDYFILSHYDVDHYGCLENLINTHYIDSETTVYLPAQVTNYPVEITARMATVNNLLEINNIPTETHNDGDIEEIGTLTLKFGNVSKSTVEAYTNKVSNAMSQVVLFNHKGVKVLYNGDAGTEVQKMLYDTNFCTTNVDLFKADHHLIDQTCNENFIYSISPTYAIQTSAIKDFVKNNYGVSEEGTILKKIGTKICSSVMQEDFIEFVSKEGVLQCKNGRPLGLSADNVDFTLYVDADAEQDEIQDGTQDHPFTEINQAIGAIQDDMVGVVTINVADGYYGNPHESEGKKNTIILATGKNIQINIVGESKSGTILNHITMRSSNLSLKDVTVDIDNGDGIRLEYNSKIVLNNVDIKSATNTLSTTYSGLVVRDGSIVEAIGSVYVTNTNQVIVATDSHIGLSANMSIGTINASNPFSLGRCTANIYSITFDNSADEAKFYGYHRFTPSPSQILSADQDTFASSYTLDKSANMFDYVDIYYITNDSIRDCLRIKMPDTGNGLGEIINAHLGGNDIRYDKCCKVTVNGTSITFTNMKQYTFTPSSNTFSVSSGSGYFKIIAVYGCFF